MSYTLIERRELAQNASSIVFSNIPQNYNDLFILVSARSSRTTDTLDDLAMVVNSITSGYSGRGFQGNGSVASSFSDDAAGTRFRYLSIITAANATSNTFSDSQIYISNYAGSANKSFSFDSSTENNATAGYNRLGMGLLANTAAITSLTFTADNGSLVQGSSISLYGINRQQAIGKPKAIGGAITFANGYWVHTFNSSGTFYAQENLSCEYLVVAGGGGSAGYYAQAGYNGLGGGGGGAGGCLNGVANVLSNSRHTVIVGAGAPATDVTKSNGFDSVFMSNRALGGGSAGMVAFGSRDGSTGTSGGSGGGGSANTDPVNGLGGAGTAGQGFAGGSGGVGLVASGGGGGGATSAGSNGSNGTDTSGGLGGAGLLSSISGSGLIYSRGGNGGTRSGEASGSANTGNGGNGRNIVTGGYAPLGFPGGSGIVIIRYLA